MKATLPELALSLAVSACLAAAPLRAQERVAALEQASADTIVEHCLAHAAGAGHDVVVAVFDQGGNLVAFKRGGAAPAAAAVAQWKGRSAAVYRTSTRETGSWNVPAAPMIATIEGGVPLFTADGAVAGGVGVSGAPPEFDAACGEIGARAAGLRVTHP